MVIKDFGNSNLKPISVQDLNKKIRPVFRADSVQYQFRHCNDEDFEGLDSGYWNKSKK